jgi:hypothetical protein
MRAVLLAIFVHTGGLSVALAQTAPAGPAKAFINEFCVSCHNDRVKRGELSLVGLDADHPEPENPIWEKAIRKVRTGMMPPVNAKRPDGNRINGFTGALETSLDRAAAAHPNPGRPLLHRLNRTEYANAVRDVLSLDIDVTKLLPPDDMTHGFDNIADVLTISPTLMDSYIRTAATLSRLAVGDRAISPSLEVYRVPQMLPQNDYVEGTPFGTRGGTAVRHLFPADGEYSFRLTFYHENNGLLFGTLQKDEQVELAIDGERVALLDINPRMLVTDELRTGPIKIQAGPRLLSASFLRRARGPAVDLVRKFETTLINIATEGPGVSVLPHLNTLAVNGPFNVTGPGDTPSRRRIFICRPATPADEEPCARKIMSALSSLAYRRPVSAADLDHLMRQYRQGRAAMGDFEGGVRLALQTMLSDPEFVFRIERVPSKARPGSNYRISDLELASRLSFFLWSSAPDEPLLRLAAAGKLRDSAVLETQIRRMLADERAEALARNFASQWLHLRNLREWTPDPRHYPDADKSLMNAMERETELFFMSIVREDRDITDLLTADYTFVNGRLAKHYNIPNVVGNRFRRVTLADGNRRGLLGHGSVLTVTSFPTRTSPVLRGKWVLDNLLGAPPPQPPPDVPALPENSHDAKPVPLRVRLQQHRANPICASCHATMDPIGFALESLDAVGAVRTFDSGERVDPSGELTDGTRLDGPAGLRRVLIEKSDVFRTAFTEKLLTYGLGRGVESHDMPAVRSIVRSAGQTNHRFSAYVLGIVNSLPFQYRRADAEEVSP